MPEQDRIESLERRVAVLEQQNVALQQSLEQWVRQVEAYSNVLFGHGTELLKLSTRIDDVEERIVATPDEQKPIGMTTYGSSSGETTEKVDQFATPEEFIASLIKQYEDD